MPSTAGAGTVTGSSATAPPLTVRCRLRWPVYRRVGDGGFDHSRQLPYVCVVEHWCRQLLGLTTIPGSSATAPPLPVRCRLRWPRLQTGRRRRFRSQPASSHTCALLNTGAVNCWGYNGFGQLGNGTTTASSAPVAVAAFTDVRRRRSRSQPALHTCAVLNTGAVNCWGNNGNGRLGNGTTTSSSAPVAVAAFTDVSATAVSITAGNSHTCAVLNTGAVNCWGSTFTGSSATTPPLPVRAGCGGRVYRRARRRFRSQPAAPIRVRC